MKNEPIKQEVKTSEERFKKYYKRERNEGLLPFDIARSAWEAQDHYYNNHMSQINKTKDDRFKEFLKTYSKDKFNNYTSQDDECLIRKGWEAQESYYASMREENEHLKTKIKWAHAMVYGVQIDKQPTSAVEPSESLKAELLALQGKYRRLEEATQEMAELVELCRKHGYYYGQAGGQLLKKIDEALASCQLEDGEKKAEGI